MRAESVQQPVDVAVVMPYVWKGAGGGRGVKTATVS